MGWEWQVLVKVCQACAWSRSQRTQALPTLNELWSLSAQRNCPCLSHITLRNAAWAASQPPSAGSRALVELMNRQEGLEGEILVFHHKLLLKKRLAVVREL